MILLLISNSTNAGESFLQHPEKQIRDFLGPGTVKAAFIPYAAVSFSFDEYEEKVRRRFRSLGHDVLSVHNSKDPAGFIRKAPAIVVGGGNTFQLTALLYRNNLMDLIRRRVAEGIPYIGWSAGANMACPTIKTTNDMPITEPESFRALGLIPFQINPHYLDAHPDDHAGETREMRIIEFTEINRDIYVAGLREGSMFLIRDKKIELTGPRNLRVFKYGKEPAEYRPGSSIGFLMEPA